jgi:hypothetical protein
MDVAMRGMAVAVGIMGAVVTMVAVGFVR